METPSPSDQRKTAEPPAESTDVVSRGLRRADLLTIARFVISGGLNTLVGHGTVFFCMLVLAMHPVTSNVVGYGIGIVFAFLMHKHFTFRSKGNAGAEFLRFLPVFGVSYAANLSVLLLCLRAGLSDIVSQSTAAIVYVAMSYLLNRTVVFRSH